MRLAEYVLRGNSPASPFPKVADCKFENICGFTFGQQYLIHWHTNDQPTEIKELPAMIDLLVSEFGAQDEYVPQLRIGAVARMWEEFRLTPSNSGPAQNILTQAAATIEVLGTKERAESLRDLTEANRVLDRPGDMNALLVLPVLKSPAFQLPPMEVFGNIIQFHVTNFNLHGSWESLFEVGE